MGTSKFTVTPLHHTRRFLVSHYQHFFPLVLTTLPTLIPQILSPSLLQRMSILYSIPSIRPQLDYVSSTGLESSENVLCLTLMETGLCWEVP